jgi:hypothetical protein
VARIIVRDLDDPMSYHIPMGSSFSGVITLVLPLPDHPFLAAYQGNAVQAEFTLQKPLTRDELRIHIHERREFLRDLISELEQVDPKLKEQYRQLALSAGRLNRSQYAETDQSPDLVQDLWVLEQDPWDEDLN